MSHIRFSFISMVANFLKQVSVATELVAKVPHLVWHAKVWRQQGDNRSRAQQNQSHHSPSTRVTRRHSRSVRVHEEELQDSSVPASKYSKTPASKSSKTQLTRANRFQDSVHKTSQNSPSTPSPDTTLRLSEIHPSSWSPSITDLHQSEFYIHTLHQECVGEQARAIFDDIFKRSGLMEKAVKSREWALIPVWDGGRSYPRPVKNTATVAAAGHVSSSNTVTASVSSSAGHVSFSVPKKCFSPHASDHGQVFDENLLSLYEHLVEFDACEAYLCELESEQNTESHSEERNGCEEQNTGSKEQHTRSKNLKDHSRDEGDLERRANVTRKSASNTRRKKVRFGSNPEYIDDTPSKNPSKNATFKDCEDFLSQCYCGTCRISDDTQGKGNDTVNTVSTEAVKTTENKTGQAGGVGSNHNTGPSSDTEPAAEKHLNLLNKMQLTSLISILCLHESSPLSRLEMKILKLYEAMGLALIEEGNFVEVAKGMSRETIEEDTRRKLKLQANTDTCLRKFNYAIGKWRRQRNLRKSRETRRPHTFSLLERVETHLSPRLLERVESLSPRKICRRIATSG